MKSAPEMTDDVSGSELLSETLGRFAKELESLEDRLSLLTQSPQVNPMVDLRPATPASLKPSMEVPLDAKSFVNDRIRALLNESSAIASPTFQNQLFAAAEKQVRLEGQIQQLVTETKVQLTEVFFEEMQDRFQIEPEQLVGVLKQQTLSESTSDRSALVDKFVSKLDIQDPVKRAEAEELYEAYLLANDTVGKAVVQDLAEKVASQTPVVNVQPRIALDQNMSAERPQALNRETNRRSDGLRSNVEVRKASNISNRRPVEELSQQDLASLIQTDDAGAQNLNDLSMSSVRSSDIGFDSQRFQKASQDPRIQDVRAQDSFRLSDTTGKMNFQQSADISEVSVEPARVVPSEEALLNSLSTRMNLAGIRERMSRPVNAAVETASESAGETLAGRSVLAKESMMPAAVGAAAAAGSNLPNSAGGEESESENLEMTNPMATDTNPRAVKNSDFKIQLNELQVPQLGQDNVTEITGRAQTLAKAGGGQMKIELTPEGMGSIELKVSVNEGRVDVSILAENQDTKRLLESKLGDLKSSLESHKLNLDQVRVDFSERANARENLMDQHNRQNAREFLQDFRQQNDNFRQNSFMNGVLDRAEARDPRAVRQFNAKQMAGRPASSSRRLDLVA